MTDGVSYGWIPLTDPGWKFGDIVALEPNHIYPAQTDGFVFATAKIDADGPRGFIEIRTFNALGTQEPLYAACAVHNFRGTNKFIDRMTATLPVSRGKTWNASLTTTVGPVNANVYWMPVVPR